MNLNTARRVLLLSNKCNRLTNSTSRLVINNYNNSNKFFHTSTLSTGAATSPVHPEQHGKEGVHSGDVQHKPHEVHHDDHGDHHQHYTDEEGRPFNIPKGDKYHFQGWEYPHYLFFVGGLLTLIIGLIVKPDYSVAAWADEEFLRRKRARESQQKNE